MWSSQFKQINTDYFLYKENLWISSIFNDQIIMEEVSHESKRKQ